MCQITLISGKTSMIDDADIDLKELKWSELKNDSKNTARTYIYRMEKRKIIYLHRMIMERVLNRKLNKNEFIDHQNGNGFDNRRTNLRLSTRSQNCANSIKRKIYAGKKSSSIYKGVTKFRNKFIAQINVNKKGHYLGSFMTEIDAAKAYDQAAELYFKEFAKKNFE